MHTLDEDPRHQLTEGQLDKYMLDMVKLDANIAAVLLKQGRYRCCIDICNRATNVEQGLARSRWLRSGSMSGAEDVLCKVLFRRALAHEGLGQTTLAADDARKLVTMQQCLGRQLDKWLYARYRLPMVSGNFATGFW
jgi:hypothetical protein